MGRIIVPEILIPRWRDLVCTTSVAVRGEMSWKLVETKRFKRPTVIRSGRQTNIIVNSGVNFWLTYGYTPTGYLGVGTGTTAPAKTQTTLVAELARVAYNSTEHAYVFSEAQANGDLTEWGAFSAGSGGTMWCRELFRDELGTPVVVTKTDTQVLYITYRYTLQRLLDSHAVDIVVDGTTYHCMTTINNAQLQNILSQVLFDAFGSARVIVGTSNAPSDLVSDTDSTIKGASLLNSSAPTKTLANYISGTYHRSYTIEFAGSQANGSIGEIVCPLMYSAGRTYYLCRSTFDPVIVKDSTKKLAVTIDLSIVN